MADKIDLKRGMSSDEIRNAFAPRDLLGGSNVEIKTGRIEILRSVKRSSSGDLFPDAIDAERSDVKDLIIDESEGIVGSQG